MKAYNLHTALQHREEVTELYLHNCRLEQLPPAIFGMPRLWKLEISANLLREIPPQIGQLKQLRSLALNFNQIEALPPQLFQLSALQELNLSNNQITVLPAAIGRLQELHRLRLAGNHLEELPGELGQLKQLQHLEIQHNRIKRLPATLGKLARLRELRAQNNLIGRIPKALYKLPELGLLDFSHNRIRTLGEEVRQWQKLTELNLSHNRLRRLPERIGQLPILRRLLLNGNKLETLPPTLGSLPWLGQLGLSRNKLSTLPEQLFSCRYLQSLQLAGNEIRQLPAVLAESESLRELDLSGNSFSHLPPLPVRLLRLSVAGNQLAELPESIQQLHFLKALDASRNQLTGLPQGFRKLYQLEKLLLKGNPISDLPRPLFFLSRLETLEGPADAAARRKLLRFLKLCRTREVPMRLRLVIYDVMEEEGRNLSTFPDSLLLEALSIGMNDVAYPIRKHLIGEGQAERQPKKGDTIYLLGETGFEPEKLRSQLAPLGIKLTEDPLARIDYLVLGRLLRAMNAAIPKNFGSIISRGSLSGFLNRQLQRKLALEPQARQVENLRRMLFHPGREKRQLALQLLRANGVPRSLLTDLFLAWKLGYGQEGVLESLLLQHTSEEALRAMYYPLGLTGRTSEATLSTNIIKYTEDNEFDGGRIARFLNEAFGTGRYYLRDDH